MYTMCTVSLFIFEKVETGNCPYEKAPRQN